ncbi:MAG TPA: hypothetical protein PKA00_08695 [Saprospiraceae bacterium]|nr:hypothetical protein [Saprospiraceae bacterium]HMQ82972.1 hypothetical protein [Saprospiraceae bacterium]
MKIKLLLFFLFIGCGLLAQETDLDRFVKAPKSSKKVRDALFSKTDIGLNIGRNLLLLGYPTHALESSNRDGWLLGIAVSKKISPLLAIRLECNFKESLGVLSDYTISGYGIFYDYIEYGDAYINFQQISFPLILEISPLKKYRLGIDVGVSVNPVTGQMGYKKFTQEILDTQAPRFYDGEGVIKAQGRNYLRYHLGLGYDLHLGEGIQARFTVRYQRSTSLYRDSGLEVFADNFEKGMLELFVRLHRAF